MVAVEHALPQGRDFTAGELIGRTVRIECPIPAKDGRPVARTLAIFADGELVANACKLELVVEPAAVIAATITLVRLDQVSSHDQTVPTEQVTLRDNIELSFSAVVSEVR